jgi:hypothetical protein
MRFCVRESPNICKSVLRKTHTFCPAGLNSPSMLYFPRKLNIRENRELNPIAALKRVLDFSIHWLKTSRQQQSKRARSGIVNLHCLFHQARRPSHASNSHTCNDVSTQLVLLRLYLHWTTAEESLNWNTDELWCEFRIICKEATVVSFESQTL